MERPKITRKGFIIAACCALTACGAEEKIVQEPTPARTVKAFYDWRLASHMTGPPDSSELASMQPYLSAELKSLLSDSAGEPKDKADDKRKFAEGDLFSSLYEGATSFSVGDPEVDGDAFMVPVRFVSAKQLPAVNWTDRVRVVQENGAYVISDIQYMNHWSFGAQRGLVESLKKRDKRRG